MSIQGDTFNFTHDNEVTFPPFVKSDDGNQIEATLSEYFLDNLLFVVHKEGLINFTDTSNTSVINVGLLELAFFNSFKGYNTSSPCTFGIVSKDPSPTIKIDGANS